MIRVVAAIAMMGLIIVALTSCPRPVAETVVEAAPDLETAAIARGLVVDPRTSNPTGLFARDTDRLCAVPAASGYRIGVYIDYGEGISCSGAGTMTRSAETLRVQLGDGACAFDARFEGDRIKFPGRVPEACARFCSPRASLSGLDVARLSESVSEASAMRDGRGKLPCAS